MPNYSIHPDYETSERAGAGGMFQISLLEEEDVEGNNIDRTDLIDQGQHYSNLEEVKEDIAKKTGVPVTDIHIDEV